MAATSKAVPHTVWDCRWSRLGYGVLTGEDHLQPETPWNCIRRNERRRVAEEECEKCPHWSRREPAISN